MGSNNEDCNRQGSKVCPSYSDACAVVVGHESESNRDSVVAFLLLALLLSLCLHKTMFVKGCVCSMRDVCVFNGGQAAVWRHI